MPMKTIFSMFILTLSTTTLSAANYMMFWIMMEMASFVFLTMSMSQENDKSKHEAFVTYYMISFLAAMLFLAGIMQQTENSLYLMQMGLTIEDIEKMSAILLTVAFLMKMGSIPFHTWIFSILKQMGWKMSMIFLTIQKIIPIYAIAVYAPNETVLMAVIASTLFMPFIPLKTKSISAFLATSATNNMTWILLTTICSTMVTMFYMMVYFILTQNLISIAKQENMKTMNQKAFSNAMVVAILSMVGMPPLLGFLPKFAAIQTAISLKSITLNIMLVLIVSNFITAYMYMKMTLSSMVFPLQMLNSVKNSMMKNLKTSWKIHMTWPILAPVLL